ncbi:MAG TPA: MarR family winged helix-turn-helix transcriptional regulator, partial [Polyangiaceae bacterium]
LGVSKTTVCKMLGAMEASGLVVRLDRNVYDRRFRRWDLTDLGRQCFEGLLKAIRLGLADEAILQAFGSVFRSASNVWKDIVQTADAVDSAALCIDPYLPCRLEPYAREAHAARARARPV